MRDSFINARNFRYAKQALLLSVTALLVYIWHEPGYVPNGGTWLGYTLGTVSFLLMLRLLWFGMQKRRYRRGGKPLRHILSAHVYLGIALAVFATLHTGFQFGFNLHTLAYTLLMLVLVSGFFGVYAYQRFPRIITDNRDNQSRDTLLRQAEQIDRECLQLAEEIGSGATAAISRLIDSTRIGGGVKELLSSRLKRAAVPKEINELFDKIKASEQRERVNDMLGTINIGRALLAEGRQGKSEQLHKLIDMLAQRKRLLDRIERDIHFKARLDIWLYLHVPLAFASVAMVIAHVIVVFLYW